MSNEIIFAINDQSKVLRVVSPNNREVIDWGLKRINAEHAWKKTKGKGVKVAVLDTGVDPKHPDIIQNLRGTINLSDSRHGVVDQNGHGSHVTGIIGAVDNEIGMIGVAPEVELYVAKVLGDNGNGGIQNIIKGIRWAMAQNVDVINLSLGTQSQPTAELHETIKEATMRGVVIVAAAGNENSTVGWPARYPETICVAASDQQDGRASFSNKGIENVITAPGVDILSTYKNGAYAELSGTSMACPIIAGAVALYIAHIKETEYRRPTTKEVYHAITKAVDDVGTAGHDADFGMGIINLAKLF